MKNKASTSVEKLGTNYLQTLRQMPEEEIRGLSGKYSAISISRKPVAWPRCNLAASQKRPYCASVNSHSPVGLVSRQ